MTTVTRLQGKTHFGSYVVSIFVESEKLSKIEISGKPHKNVTELCETRARTHTTLTADSIKAIKLTMAKHCEYYGESPLNERL